MQLPGNEQGVCVCVCVCARACVCVRERERQTDRWTDRACGGVEGGI